MHLIYLEDLKEDIEQVIKCCLGALHCVNEAMKM